MSKCKSCGEDFEPPKKDPERLYCTRFRCSKLYKISKEKPCGFENIPSSTGKQYADIKYHGLPLT